MFKMLGGSFPKKLDPSGPNTIPMMKRIKTGVKKNIRILSRLEPIILCSAYFFLVLLVLPDIGAASESDHRKQSLFRHRDRST
jgi:hypothetical protein